MSRYHNVNPFEQNMQATLNSDHSNDNSYYMYRPSDMTLNGDLQRLKVPKLKLGNLDSGFGNEVTRNSYNSSTRNR